jgi:hypothetical protein
MLTSFYRSVIGCENWIGRRGCKRKNSAPEPWQSNKSREEELGAGIGNEGVLFCLLITSITGWRFAIIVLFHRHVLPQSNPILLILLGFLGDHERLEPDSDLAS